MKRILQKIILPCVLFFPLLAWSQCMLVPVSIQERVSQASLIVEGRVVAQYSFFSGGKILTDNRIELFKILKGTADSGFVHILTEGGTVGDITAEVTSVLGLNKGEVGVFTCTLDKSKAAYTAYASAQGFIRYDDTYTTARDVFTIYTSVKDQLLPTISNLAKQNARIIKPLPTIVQSNERVDNTAAAVITSFSPDTIAAGVSQVLTINGSGFGAIQGSSYLQFSDADNGGASLVKPMNLQYLTWGDSQITLYMPSTEKGSLLCAGGGTIRLTVGGKLVQSPKSLVVNYAEINAVPDTSGLPVQNYLVGNSQTGGYTFQMNSDFDTIAKGTAKAAFLRSFNKWRCASSINWVIEKALTSIDTVGFDQVNVISFDSPQHSLPAGVLGSTTNWYSSCNNQDVFISAIDMVYARNQKWSFDSATTVKANSGKYDFESVLLHELGHAQQLAHNTDTKCLMYWSLGTGVVKNTIDKGSLAGTSYIIKRSVEGTVCSQNSIVYLPANLCDSSYISIATQPSLSVVAVPNPFTGSTSVSLVISQTEQLKMELFDSFGNNEGLLVNQTVSAGQQSISIDFTHKARGLYFLRTTIGGNVYVTKLFNAAP